MVVAPACRHPFAEPHELHDGHTYFQTNPAIDVFVVFSRTTADASIRGAVAGRSRGG